MLLEMEISFTLQSLILIFLTIPGVVFTEIKCLLLEAEGKEATVESPGWPDGYINNMHLCWLIRSTSKDEKVRLEVQQSSLQPRSYSGEWTDYLQVADGDCKSGRVVRRWAGTDVPDSIESSGSTLCLRFVSDGSIRDKGFVITYSNTGGEGTPLSTIITVILVIIGVSTVAIVAIVIYFMCRRSKAREAASHEHRTDPPHDPLDDAFPPSYSVAVQGQDADPTNVPSISENVMASGIDRTSSHEDRTYEEKKIIDDAFGSDVLEPPSYTSITGTENPPALHRSPPGQYSIPGVDGPFQPF